MVDSDECDENSARHHKTEHSPTVLAVDDTNDGHKRKRRKKKKCTAEDTALNPQVQFLDYIVFYVYEGIIVDLLPCVLTSC